MSKQINLDRSIKQDISYPIGVTESIKYTDDSLTDITDVYEIVIAKQNGDTFETISEGGGKLTKVANTLTWLLKYEHGDISVTSYDYEIRNITKDYIEFRGKLIVTKTLE